MIRRSKTMGCSVKTFYFIKVINSDYVNVYDAGGRQVFAMKTTLFDPTILLEKAQGIRASRIVREVGTFVVLGFRTYRSEFNNGYNIVAATSCGDHLWLRDSHEYCQANAIGTGLFGIRTFYCAYHMDADDFHHQCFNNTRTLRHGEHS